VLAAKRRLGFGSAGHAERFVVVQSDELAALEFVIVAPLEVDGPLYERYPLAVHVTAREAGSKQPHVVLVHLLTALHANRFEAARVGGLSTASMAKIDTLLRVVLQLPSS
jgi:mRNA-degrading endonuclease toxin of MazEF toxin-antitoxin module